MKLPEAEVQSFAVALRYMYTDCIFPLVKGENLSFPRCIKSRENVPLLSGIVTKRERESKTSSFMIEIQFFVSLVVDCFCAPG